MKQCPECWGRGEVPMMVTHWWKPCPTCKGSGAVFIVAKPSTSTSEHINSETENRSGS